MDTVKTIEEIEVALAQSRNLGFYRGLIAYNVIGLGANLAIGHECDMLVLTKSNYLMEVEIKRSFSDFLNDFKKPHRNEVEENGIISCLYYAVPSVLRGKCYNELVNNNIKAGLILYTEDLYCFKYSVAPRISNRKLTNDEIIELGRLASLKVIAMKRKIAKLQNNIKETKHLYSKGDKE